jgi:HlyD family secretion protein
MPTDSSGLNVSCRYSELDRSACASRGVGRRDCATAPGTGARTLAELGFQRGTSSARVAEVFELTLDPTRPRSDPSDQAAVPRKRAWAKWLLAGAGCVALGALAFWLWLGAADQKLPEGITVTNGRLEAVQTDVATKLAGRVTEVLVRPGDRVEAGRVVARMDAAPLRAMLREAEAQVAAAESQKASAQQSVTYRESAEATVAALIVQRRSDQLLADQNFERAQKLLDSGALAREQFDRARSTRDSAAAVLAAAKAQQLEAKRATALAVSQVASADKSVAAAVAATERVRLELDETELKAPCACRVQHVLVQPGEVLGAGGKLLALVDLSDVYMTVFLPEVSAGRVAIGDEARLVLDAAPNYVIAARVSYVAAEAQFTPKVVETQSEREKFVFEARLQLDPELLRRYEPFVKVGLPGVGYVRVSRRDWPPSLRPSFPPEVAPAL